MGYVTALIVLFGTLQERGGRFERSVSWFPSVDRASEARRPPRGEEGERPPVPKKFILLYVRPALENRDPNLFSDSGLVRRSHEEWAFVKIDLDPSNPRLKEWNIRRAPMIAGLDIHGNEFLKTSTVSITAVRSLMKALPVAVERYRARLRSDVARAAALMAKSESRGIATLRDIVASGKRGYPEVAEARNVLDDHAGRSFRKADLAESVSLETGVAYLEELAKLYRETPYGVRAEIRLARLENALGRRRDAEQRLKRILKLDGPGFRASVDEARALLAKLSR